METKSENYTNMCLFSTKHGYTFMPFYYGLYGNVKEHLPNYSSILTTSIGTTEKTVYF